MSKKPNSIVEELDRIARGHGGLLKPEYVVDAASDPESVLHDRFTWDDSDAAREYRLWQARQLIRCSVSMEPRTEKTVRAFVSLTTDRSGDGGGYRSTVAVMRRREYREQLLEDALAELRVFERKYAALTELAEVFAVSRRLRGR